MRMVALSRSNLSGLGYSAQGIPPGDSCYDSSHDPGMYHCSDWINSLFSSTYTTACSAKESACMNYGTSPIALTPALSQATSPGLPVGYDATTGTVDPSNTTGATVAPPDYGNAISGQLPPAACASESLMCTALGVGCVDSSCGPGITTMLMVGAAVLLAFFFSADYVAGKSGH
jgi:hypothetical protein